jgi:hypothetical protein
VNDPVLLLDSTVLVAYERDLSRRAQAVVLEALADGRLMVTAALSLAVACAELGGETRELAWLVYDRDGPLSVLPLGLGAMEVGAAASGGGKTAGELEGTQVIHEARATSAVVLTYDFRTSTPATAST